MPRLVGRCYPGCSGLPRRSSGAVSPGGRARAGERRVARGARVPQGRRPTPTRRATRRTEGGCLSGVRAVRWVVVARRRVRRSEPPRSVAAQCQHPALRRSVRRLHGIGTDQVEGLLELRVHPPVHRHQRTRCRADDGCGRASGPGRGGCHRLRVVSYGLRAKPTMWGLMIGMGRGPSRSSQRTSTKPALAMAWAVSRSGWQLSLSALQAGRTKA